MTKFLLILFINIITINITFADSINIVARVKGSIITSKDVNHRQQLYKILQDKQIAPKVIIKELVNEKVYNEICNAYNILLSSKEFSYFLANILEQMKINDLNLFLSTNKIEEDHFNQYIKTQARWQKFLLTILMPSIKIKQSELINFIDDPQLIAGDVVIYYGQKLNSAQIKYVNDQVKSCSDLIKYMKKKVKAEEPEKFYNYLLIDFKEDLIESLLSMFVNEVKIRSANDGLNDVMMLCDKRIKFPNNEYKERLYNHVKQLKLTNEVQKLLDQFKREVFVEE
jgi:hypothetical protein